MRIKIFSLLICVFSQLAFGAKPAEVSKQEAKIIAGNFYREKSRNHLSQIIFGDEYTISHINTIVLYAFNVNDGFIIISANDAVFPVVAYSYESTFSEENFPDGFDLWLENYKLQIYFSFIENRKASNVIQKIWHQYENWKFKAKEVLTGVEPMLHTTWHQGCYYNTLFPLEPAGPCGHLWAGCVATAMAQIMKYYNYPDKGFGYYSYNSTYGLIEADFENAEYTWGEMDYHLTAEDSSVAHLIYHCAVSVHSQFFPYGTGAYDFNVRNALVNYFDYKTDAQFYWRDSYTGDWKEMLRSELELGRPVIYGGADSETGEGHTLVCDGYQDSSFFHFNWGWNGYYNGYYYIDSLIASGHYYDLQHDAVVGIFPDVNAIYISPPLDIEVTESSSNITISWSAPELPGNLEFLGYNVFRNGNIINSQIITDLFFIDVNPPEGWQTYNVSAVYIGKEILSPQGVNIFIEGSSISDQVFQSLGLFPNPVSNTLFVLAENEFVSDLIITISDITGFKHIEQYFTGYFSELSVPVFKLESGIYLVSIHNDKFNFCQKIMILK